MSVRFVNPEGLSPPIGFSHAAVGEGQAIAIAGQIGGVCGVRPRRSRQVRRPGRPPRYLWNDRTVFREADRWDTLRLLRSFDAFR